MMALIRFLLRLLYRFEAHDLEALSTPGPALLVPNHVSWLDWIFVAVCLDRDWRFVTSRRVSETSWLHRKIMTSRRTFPIDPLSPYSVRDMAAYLEQGGRLVLFAEGRISSTGQLMKLFDGTGFLIRRTGAHVITCYVRGANRLPFVLHSGWTRWFPRVSAHFSKIQHAPPPRPGCSYREDRQQTTAWLRDLMVRQQFDVEMELSPVHVPAALAEIATAIPGHVILEDVTFEPLTFRRVLTATGLLARSWRRRFGAQPNERIGILLPNINGFPLTLFSLWSACKVPALLNYSSGVATLLACIRLAGLSQVITSRQFLEKVRINPAPLIEAGIELVFLEDIRAGISKFSQAVALMRHILSPGAELRRLPLAADDTAVILFTSGSEGVPKGVELTHRNLLANIRQVSAVLDLGDNDRIFNALPLFHSFGLTGGTLFPLLRGCFVLLYPSPLHYRIVPSMVYAHDCTVLLGTNTFLNGYARMAHPYDFASLRFLVAGAEKVQEATIDTWSRRFGVRICEGYGATECGPVLSVNTRIEPKVGTAGRLLPAIEYRLEPVEGVEEGGRLFVRGPNIMKGYLNPEANAAFQALGGWYDTGDIAWVDADRFIHIRGRLKRFAKISGEMVSLAAVEDALVGAFRRFGLRCQVAILSRPDADKGEVLVAVTNDARVQLAEIRAVIRDRGLPNLAAPREVFVVPAIPKLGTGKINHRELERVLAESRD